MVPIKGSYGGVNYLENDFFPFDPFLLRQSQQYIQPLYQKWEGSTRVTHRRGSTSGPVLSPKDEYLEEFVGRGRGNSITDRAKMFFSGSLNQPKVGSLGSNSTKLGSSLMDDDDMFSDDEDGDDDVDFDEDVSSSDEGEVHYDDEEDHSMFMSAVELRNGMNRKTPTKSGSYSRSVEEDNLFSEIPVPYGWEYTLDVYSTERKRGRK